MTDRPVDHNPFIDRNSSRTPSTEGGKGAIETPGSKPYNMAWQTRRRKPTEYEAALSRTLEGAFASGVETLPAIVAALNASDLKPPAAETWTEDNFKGTIARLEALPGDADAPQPRRGGGIVPQ